jgi:hypothetical protein
MLHGQKEDLTVQHRFIALASIAIPLAACQASAPAVQTTSQLQEVSQLRAMRDAVQITYTEWAERTGAAARANVALTPDQVAAIEYRTSLARRVDAGELTPAQFEAESARTLRRLKAAQS